MSILTSFQSSSSSSCSSSPSGSRSWHPVTPSDGDITLRLLSQPLGMANSGSGTDYLLLLNFVCLMFLLPFACLVFQPHVGYVCVCVYVCVDVYVVVWIPSLLCLRTIEVGKRYVFVDTMCMCVFSCFHVDDCKVLGACWEVWWCYLRVLERIMCGVHSYPIFVFWLSFHLNLCPPSKSGVHLSNGNCTTHRVCCGLLCLCLVRAW